MRTHDVTHELALARIKTGKLGYIFTALTNVTCDVAANCLTEFKIDDDKLVTIYMEDKCYFTSAPARSTTNYLVQIKTSNYVTMAKIYGRDTLVALAYDLTLHRALPLDMSIPGWLDAAITALRTALDGQPFTGRPAEGRSEGGLPRTFVTSELLSAIEGGATNFFE